MSSPVQRAGLEGIVTALREANSKGTSHRVCKYAIICANWGKVERGMVDAISELSAYEFGLPVINVLSYFRCVIFPGLIYDRWIYV